MGWVPPGKAGRRSCGGGNGSAGGRNATDGGVDTQRVGAQREDHLAYAAPPLRKRRAVVESELLGELGRFDGRGGVGGGDARGQVAAGLSRLGRVEWILLLDGARTEERTTRARGLRAKLA